MSRNHVEINPECGRRLKELLILKGVTQLDLAEKLSYKPQHISNIVCGKRSLTLDIAHRIKSEIFPAVRVEWLLCIDDFMTEEDKEYEAKRAWEERNETITFYDKVFRCFIDSIEDLSGYGLHSQEADSFIGNYIPVSDASGKKIGAIPAESFDHLKQEIENFASYSINLLIRNEMISLPNSAPGGEVNG